MVTANNAAERARWEVIWVRGGRLHRVATGNDFAEALRLYGLAITSPDRANVTLRCCNMAFPPPEKYHDRVVTFDKPRRLKNGKRVTSVRIRPMVKLNREGVWWCPFCVKLRRFKFEKGWTTTEGIYVAEPRMRCPVCKVDHNSFDVRKWNPLATTMFYNQSAYDPTAPPKRVRRRRPRKPPEEE